jgi:hypothetical protein
MPFLLPALASAVCDVAIIYLRRTAPEHDENTSRRIYLGKYILPLAIIRLFLLLVPLPYHSYHGKALRCPMLFQVFYVGTLIILFFHSLSLIMIDPGSLGSLLILGESSTSPPGNSTSSSSSHHNMVTRNLWWSLILTLVSTLCHVALFFHVRSTAPTDAELLKGRPKVLLYYVKEHEDTERESLLLSDTKEEISLGVGSVSSNRVQEISTKLMTELQVSLLKAKGEWTKRLEDYQFRSSGAVTNQDLLLKQPLTPFRVVLELFAGEDVLTNGRLDDVYNQDDGAALMFFIPQLLSFLLHGAYESSPQLEEWVLDTCRKNLFFAQKSYWFLRAWALESSNIQANRMSKSSSLASFETSDEPAVDHPTNVRSRLLPEERAVIEELMRKIMECGEEPARLLHSGLGGYDQNHISNTTTNGYSDHERDIASSSTSPSALMFAAESGAIPIDPSSGLPSAKHFECLAATKRYGFLPLENALTTNSPCPSKNRNKGITHKDSGSTSHFDSNTVFMDALIKVADNLFKIPREIRNEEFRRQLDLLEVEALPCNEIYIPLQDPHHRVWRIVSDESIAITTKERVPCIICLEVVDYSSREVPTARDLRKLLEERSKGSVKDPNAKSTASERETVGQWRFSQRDPHRRETAFEKLTHSVLRRGIGKLPDQVNRSMREQIKRLKNAKSDMHDFWSIKIPDTFSFDMDEDAHGNVPDNLHNMEPLPGKDIERGDECDGNGEELSESRKVPLIPAGQPGSPRLSSNNGSAMGQWSSPSLKGEEIQANAHLALEELAAPTLKHRSYQAVNSGLRSSNSSTPFGIPPRKRISVDEELNQMREANGDEGTPSKPPTKPPPVVFKENWKEKEDRLRSKSAFGNHPGWRLLPVLVKSNDDLRQEQLASQLIYRMALILARERVPVWLCPYEILALEASGGIIEAIPDTISIASLKKNDPDYTSLKDFFSAYFYDSDDLSDAKANFCESLAAYSIVCFLLQIKDRHNGNILLDNRGHLIHIDFGFFFLSSPGKNTGFESAPFKLTREFVDVLEGPDSHLFGVFRSLCYRSFIALRKHCHEIILLVEMLKLGNEELKCFRGRPDDAIKELRSRFRLDLNDRACFEYVNALIDESLENWRTNWYDRYQRYCVGVL